MGHISGGLINISLSLLWVLVPSLCVLNPSDPQLWPILYPMHALVIILQNSCRITFSSG